MRKGQMRKFLAAMPLFLLAACGDDKIPQRVGAIELNCYPSVIISPIEMSGVSAPFQIIPPSGSDQKPNGYHCSGHVFNFR